MDVAFDGYRARLSLHRGRLHVVHVPEAAVGAALVECIDESFYEQAGCRPAGLVRLWELPLRHTHAATCLEHAVYWTKLRGRQLPHDEHALLAAVGLDPESRPGVPKAEAERAASVLFDPHSPKRSFRQETSLLTSVLLALADEASRGVGLVVLEDPFAALDGAEADTLALRLISAARTYDIAILATCSSGDVAIARTLSNDCVAGVFSRRALILWTPTSELASLSEEDDGFKKILNVNGKPDAQILSKLAQSEHTEPIHISDGPAAAALCKVHGERPSAWQKYAAVWLWETRLSMRSLTFWVMQTLFMSAILLYAFTYFRIGADPGAIDETPGALLFACIFAISLFSFGALQAARAHIPAYARDRRTGVLSAPLFVSAELAAFLFPVRLPLFLGFFLGTYYILGMRTDGFQYALVFEATLGFFAWGSAAIGLAMGALAPRIEYSHVIFATVLLSQALFATLPNNGTVTWILLWLQFVDPMFYAEQALVHNELSGRPEGEVVLADDGLNVLSVAAALPASFGFSVLSTIVAIVLERYFSRADRRPLFRPEAERQSIQS